MCTGQRYNAYGVVLQLQQCQDLMLELEKQLENPYDEKRVRYLDGKDLPPAELHEKIEDVSLVLRTIVRFLYISIFKIMVNKGIIFF